MQVTSCGKRVAPGMGVLPLLRTEDIDLLVPITGLNTMTGRSIDAGLATRATHPSAPQSPADSAAAPRNVPVPNAPPDRVCSWSHA